jgi:hypothetical protein
VDTVNLSHKLSYAGARSPVPFTTGPEYTNSVPGVPVLAELRVFIPPELWSQDNVVIAAKEICRILGPQAQFDIGITRSGPSIYDADLAASGDVARLMKMSSVDPVATLLIEGTESDQTYTARFPGLHFEPGGESFWRSTFAPGVVKEPAQL